MARKNPHIEQIAQICFVDYTDIAYRIKCIAFINRISIASLSSKLYDMIRDTPYTITDLLKDIDTVYLITGVVPRLGLLLDGLKIMKLKGCMSHVVPELKRIRPYLFT